ncbi:putative RTA1 domain protein, partial [Trichodelitschia bisporula]
ACTVDTCPLILSYWGYRPSIPINAAFLGIFAAYTILLVIQAVVSRRFKKYTAVVMIGTVMEVIGYIARIYAYSYPFSDLSFITQLTCLTLAPAFFAAGIYFSLQRIVMVFGGQNSRIAPRLIPRIFISCDAVSLVLQGGGGALAAWYAQHEKMPDNGNYTMIGGLSFQALTLLAFLCLSGDFAIRTVKAKKKYGDQAMNEDLVSRRLRRSKPFQCLLVSLATSAVLIFFRSIYRVAELSEGWKGHLMTTEKFVIFFEFIPIALAGFLLSIFHPGFCFRD